MVREPNVYGWVNGNPVYSRDEFVFEKRGFGPIELDDELMAFAEKVSHGYQNAGWKRPFIDAHLGDNDWDEPGISLTRKEYARLKEIQKAMREERAAFNKARYARYYSGTATREDMVWLCDRDIEKESAHGDYWVNMAKKHKELVLDTYDNGGEPVGVAMIDRSYSDGYDYEKWLYTDGSVREFMYGAY